MCTHNCKLFCNSVLTHTTTRPIVPCVMDVTDTTNGGREMKTLKLMTRVAVVAGAYGLFAGWVTFIAITAGGTVAGVVMGCVMVVGATQVMGEMAK